MITVEHDATLQALIDRIVETVDPLRIILFGSRALGTAGPDSDYDLPVVMPEGVAEREVAGDLYFHKRGIDAAVDFLVATNATLERHRHNSGLIYKEILDTGAEVYTKPGSA